MMGFRKEKRKDDLRLGATDSTRSGGRDHTKGCRCSIVRVKQDMLLKTTQRERGNKCTYWISRSELSEKKMPLVA